MDGARAALAVQAARMDAALAGWTADAAALRDLARMAVERSH